MMSLTLTLPSFNDSSNVSCELQLMSAATSMSNLRHDVAAFFSNQEMLNWLDQVNKRKNNGTCQNWGQVGPKIFVKIEIVSNRGCIILYREGIVSNHIVAYCIVSCRGMSWCRTATIVIPCQWANNSRFKVKIVAQPVSTHLVIERSWVRNPPSAFFFFFLSFS